ncbi:hypothetical protein HK405_002472 [Cladochytrium tenue]|nr:hypothetical protein HK405_002472 [Cladochytrium tenue]
MPTPPPPPSQIPVPSAPPLADVQLAGVDQERTGPGFRHGGGVRTVSLGSIPPGYTTVAISTTSTGGARHSIAEGREWLTAAQPASDASGATWVFPSTEWDSSQDMSQPCTSEAGRATCGEPGDCPADAETGCFGTSKRPAANLQNQATAACPRSRRTKNWWWRSWRCRRSGGGRGSGQRRPWFLAAMTVVQLAAAAAGMWANQDATGELVQTRPAFNYLVGPAPGVLVRLGARFAPCMRGALEPPLPACLVGTPAADATAGNSSSSGCDLDLVCGTVGGLAAPGAAQWFRFVTAVVVHGGVVPLALNLAVQVRLGFKLERELGSARVAAVYIAGGVGSFLFAGRYAPLRPAAGCSGALLGIIALLAVHLCEKWASSTPAAAVELARLVVLVAALLVVGTLPGVDNLVQVGGLLFGGLAALAVGGGDSNRGAGEWKSYARLAVRVIAAPALLAVGVSTARDFYSDVGDCVWCRYIDCPPGLPWCPSKWAAATGIEGSQVI